MISFRAGKCGNNRNLLNSVEKSKILHYSILAIVLLKIISKFLIPVNGQPFDLRILTS